jgi:hypothetical protein
LVRRLLFLVICVGIVASNASAGPTGTTARYTCGAKKMTFYFWPQGHHAVPSLRFSEFTTPHLEAYTSSGSFHAFVDAKGALSYAKACKRVADLPARWTGATRKTITTTLIVNCSFPAAAELKASKAAGGGLLIATIGHTTKLAVLASLRSAGSRLTFDTRYCRTSPAPQQAAPMKYAFSGLTASFNLHGTPISYALSGEVCGDPSSTPWSIGVSLNGTAQPARQVLLRVSAAVDATSIVFKDASGAEVARAALQLTFTTGPPPQMALGVAPSGDVTNIQVGGTPAAVTAAAVASCR